MGVTLGTTAFSRRLRRCGGRGEVKRFSSFRRLVQTGRLFFSSHLPNGRVGDADLPLAHEKKIPAVRGCEKRRGYFAAYAARRLFLESKLCLCTKAMMGLPHAVQMVRRK